MKRKQLDILGGAVFIVLALVMVVVGLYLKSNADFAHDQVTTQLTAQNITFTPADRLSEEELQSEGLVKYAGMQLTTGEMAEVYANDYIAHHLDATNGGKTYSETSGEYRAAAAAAAEAKANGAADAAELQATADDLGAKRQTLFMGESLRGILLTSYMAEVIGDKADQVAIWVFLGAALVLVLGLGGLSHALMAASHAKEEAVAAMPGLAGAAS